MHTQQVYSQVSIRQQTQGCPKAGGKED